MGNNIFDAIAGAPGTYLNIDMYGNVGWGFSLDLYRATVNLNDLMRKELANGNNLNPCPPPASCPMRLDLTIGYPMAGFQAVFINSATDVEGWGPVPEILNALENIRETSLGIQQDLVKAFKMQARGQNTGSLLQKWQPYIIADQRKLVQAMQQWTNVWIPQINIP